METPSSIKDIKLPTFGKILKWGVPLAILAVIVWGVNAFVPAINMAADNLWQLTYKVGPFVLAGSLYLMNKTAINLWWVGKCHSISTALIKMDPLSVMRGYLISLRKKIKNMEATVLFLNGKKLFLGNLIKKKEAERRDFEKMAIASQRVGEMTGATLNAKKALACKGSIELYQPIFERYEKSTEYLGKLLENWNESANSTAFTIENKTEEFETLKSMYDGLKSIDDLTRSDSPEVQAFVESMKALENDMSQRQAFIDDFEKRSQPILTDMKVRKQADSDDALKLLEELAQNSNLELPNYQTFTPSFSSDKIEDIQYVKSDNKYKF